jgi:hypothetical protein
MREFLLSGNIMYGGGISAFAPIGSSVCAGAGPGDGCWLFIPAADSEPIYDTRHQPVWHPDTRHTRTGNTDPGHHADYSVWYPGNRNRNRHYRYGNNYSDHTCPLTLADSG